MTTAKRGPKGLAWLSEPYRTYTLFSYRTLVIRLAAGKRSLAERLA
jgi:hypothetical protein